MTERAMRRLIVLSSCVAAVAVGVLVLHSMVLPRHKLPRSRSAGTIQAAEGRKTRGKVLPGSPSAAAGALTSNTLATSASAGEAVQSEVETSVGVGAEDPEGPREQQ